MSNPCPPFPQPAGIRNRRLQAEALQHLVQLLPPAHRDTLHSLLVFLGEVARNATDRRNETGEWLTGNRMDSSNLATLFAPNILHTASTQADELSAEGAEERADTINVVRAMIDNSEFLFQVRVWGAGAGRARRQGRVSTELFFSLRRCQPNCWTKCTCT